MVNSDANQKNIEKSDEFLMDSFQSGSEDAFELIFDRYSSRMINFAYRFLGLREESEDIAQEVFLRVYRGKERYDAHRPFRPWLFSIASRLISNRLRDRKRHPKESIDRKPDENSDSSADIQFPEDLKYQPQEIMEKQQIISLVQKALAELPETQRMAVILARFEEMSYEEIAQTMELSVSAVKSLLFRARESLKISLNPNFGLNPAIEKKHSSPLRGEG